LSAEGRHHPALWLALAVLLAYANSLQGAFQFDDYNVIVFERRVHSWSAWYGDLGEGIRPLLKLSYTLNWTLGAGLPGFHAVNLALHLLATLLVHRLGLRFVQRLRRPDLFAAPWAAALVFAVHPVHTEAVTYVSGRSSCLMSVCYLASILCHVEGRMRGRRWLTLVASPLLFALALAAKETAVTLPLALLLWEAAAGRRSRDDLAATRPHWLLLALAALYFLSSGNYFDAVLRGASLGVQPGNLATQCAAAAYLLRQWFLPLWLNLDPQLPRPGGVWALPGATACLALWVAATVLTWSRRPWLALALAWALLHLVPLHLLLPRADVANERQLYLVSGPLALALVVELRLLLGQVWLRPAVLALAVVLGGLTLARNQVYATEVALWEDTARKSPEKARVHNNLGYAYLQEGRLDAAEAAFERALALDPRLYLARYNLQRLGRMRDAGASAAGEQQPPGAEDGSGAGQRASP
jgi:tetratricopeptide (TPR) repeat protein